MFRVSRFEFQVSRFRLSAQVQVVWIHIQAQSSGSKDSGFGCTRAHLGYKDSGSMSKKQRFGFTARDFLGGPFFRLQTVGKYHSYRGISKQVANHLPRGSK